VNSSNTVINSVTINNYYGSRNSNNTNIRYANRDVRNGVTAVPQESFGRGRRVNQDFRALPASQLSSARVFSAPTVAPQRESLLGSRADTAGRAARPRATVLSRPVVARRAPAAASLPFARQQQGLAQNPGRPLPVQQTRQGSANANSPVRVVDMGRIRRVRPAVGGAQQPNVTPPASAGERRNGPFTRQQSPQQTAQPPVVIPPPVTEQRNRPGQREQPAAQTPAVVPQVPAAGQQRNRPAQPQRQRPAAQAPAVVPQSPAAEQQRNRPDRQRQETVAPPRGDRPQSESRRGLPAEQNQSRQKEGNENRRDQKGERERKSDK
jgi:hypothetical protein